MTATVAALACPPRYSTARTDRPTYGADIEAIHAVLTGNRFMPWQRHVCDIAFEHDDDGKLIYRYLCLIVPRQAGKSSLCEAIIIWSCLRGPDRTIIYTAQTREMARKRIIEELELKRLARSRLAQSYTCRRSVGSEQIRFTNQSHIAIVSNTSDAGHGLTIDVGVIDEAWAQQDFSLIDALDPAMITRPDPMFVFTSTVGDGSDALLLHYQQLGRTGADDGATDGIAYFEWSAEPDDDIDDPAVWWRVHPALGHTVTEDALKARLATTPKETFARAYLCRRPSMKDSQVFDHRLWTSRGSDSGPSHDAPVTLALDVAPERQGASVAVCAVRPDGGSHVVVVDRRPGTDWIVPAIGNLVKNRQVRCGVIDSRGPAASLISSLEDATPGLDWKQLTTGQVVQSAGRFYDAVMAEPALVRHCSQQDLDRAVSVARRRPVGDAWAWGRKGANGDVTPLVAATLAYYGMTEFEHDYGGDLFIF